MLPICGQLPRLEIKINVTRTLNINWFKRKTPKSRDVFYDCQGLQPMRSQEEKRKIKIQSSNVLSPQKLQDFEDKTETSD